MWSKQTAAAPLRPSCRSGHGTFDTDVGLLKIKPGKICLRDNAVPYSVNTARRVSAPMLPKVKAELERMVKCGVIEGVTEPTEWCNPMVPVPK